MSPRGGWEGGRREQARPSIRTAYRKVPILYTHTLSGHRPTDPFEKGKKQQVFSSVIGNICPGLSRENGRKEKKGERGLGRFLVD